MRQITYDIVADGGTDRALIPILEWAIHRVDPSVEILEPSFRKRSGGVENFFATYETGAMLVFAHRDAERASLKERSAEFDSVERSNLVRVVPVRMTEAWLLFDATAIAKAAGNPSAEPSLPALTTVESLVDPKSELERLLFECSGSPTGRRRKVFVRRAVEMRIAVADYIVDFAPLEETASFAAFMRSLRETYPY